MQHKDRTILLVFNLPVEPACVPVSEIAVGQVAGSRALKLHPRVSFDGLLFLRERHVVGERHPHEPVGHDLPERKT